MLLSINLMEGFQCFFVYDDRKQENIPVYIPCDQKSLRSSWISREDQGRDWTRGRDLCLQGNDLGVGCES